MGQQWLEEEARGGVEGAGWVQGCTRDIRGKKGGGAWRGGGQGSGGRLGSGCETGFSDKHDKQMAGGGGERGRP